MNYITANTSLTGRCKESRKVGNNTYLQRRNGNIVVKLHNTDIITYLPNGDTILNTGGWFTPTTKSRMNEFIEGMITQSRGRWFYHHDGSYYSDGVPFSDGMVIHSNGTVSGIGKAESSKDKVLKQKIRTYAKLCASKVPLDKPDSGDCWYCSLRTEEGKTMGDISHNTSHILSHMKEGYVVPSLVFNAMVSVGYEPQRNIQFSFVFDNADSEWALDMAKDCVERSVYRYVCKQLGFAV